MEKIVYVLYLLMVISRSQKLDSPCPTVFQYRYDQQIGLYGEISIIVDPTNFVQINLQISIGGAVEGKGNLELIKPKEAIDNILHRRPISYHVYFPVWNGIPPKITQILANGNLICSGSKIPMTLVRIVTTINLQHTLTINVPLSSSDIPPDNNILVLGQKFPIPENKPPIEELPGGRFNFYDTPPPEPPERNRFNFSPTIPTRQNGLSGEKNRFNFYPTYAPSKPNRNEGNSGQNPANVYRGNPFFQNVPNGAVDSTNIQNSPKPVQNQPPSPNLNSRDDMETSINFSDEELDFVSKDSSQPVRPYENVCGQSITTNHLIFNGNVVPRGAFPWLVAIFHVKRNGLNYICSGSLISDRHVVTAAHCVKNDQKIVNAEELLLILGKLNIQKWIPSNGEKIVEPASIHVHSDYESMTSDADIAVLVLSERLQFTKYIRPVCLWRGNTDLDHIVGNLGTVVGWGKDEKGILMTEEPKQVNLPIVSQEKCLASNYRFHYITSNRTFCAGFRNGTGPCNGDSGGGFVVKENDRWVLRGIVSISISESTMNICDLSNYVVFCDASKYINWLLSFLK